jgi:hypothetical protein
MRGHAAGTGSTVIVGNGLQHAAHLVRRYLARTVMIRLGNQVFELWSSNVQTG